MAHTLAHMPPSMLETLSMYKMSVKQWSLKAINRHLFSLCSSSSIFTFFFHYYCVYFFLFCSALHLNTGVCCRAELRASVFTAQSFWFLANGWEEYSIVCPLQAHIPELKNRLQHTTPAHAKAALHTHTYTHDSHTHCVTVAWSHSKGGGTHPATKKQYTHRDIRTFI